MFVVMTKLRQPPNTLLYLLVRNAGHLCTEFRRRLEYR
jgi:hypothetical protein